MTNLKEAREIAKDLRKWRESRPLLDIDEATIILDDRITEFEKRFENETYRLSQMIRKLEDRIEDMAEQAILLTRRIAELTTQRDELRGVEG